MKKFVFFLCIAAFTISCANDKKEKPSEVKTTVVPSIDSTLITDSSWGAITPRTDFAGLQHIFGTANIKDERICGPECADTIDVTKIYPGTNKEIIVHWSDKFYHKIILSLESSEEGNPYHTFNGIRMGSTLQDLLKLNGKKITFWGFDWDYGGYIQSYNNGALEKSTIGYRMELAENADNSLSGDAEFDTDMPAAKKMLDKITIYLLSLTLNKDPVHEH
jgi:hypothetical protein